MCYSKSCFQKLIPSCIFFLVRIFSFSLNDAQIICHKRVFEWIALSSWRQNYTLQLNICHEACKLQPGWSICVKNLKALAYIFNSDFCCRNQKFINQFSEFQNVIQYGLEIHGLKLHGTWQCTFLNRVQKIWDEQIYVVETVFWSFCLYPIK